MWSPSGRAADTEADYGQSPYSSAGVSRNPRRRPHDQHSESGPSSCRSSVVRASGQQPTDHCSTGRRRVESQSTGQRSTATRRSFLALAGTGTLHLAGCLGNSAYRFLALGDSYTAGTGVDPGEEWPRRLPRRLGERGIALSDPDVVAESGWTTLDLTAELDRREGRLGESTTDSDLLRDEYDLVTLCIGVNDAFNERLPESFAPDFAGLLDRAISFSGGRADHVLALTIPDYTVTPLAQRQLTETYEDRLAEYNRIVVEEAAARNVRTVDLVPPSRRVLDDPDLVADDDLHPSPKQHGLWLDRIEPVVAEVLAD